MRLRLRQEFAGPAEELPIEVERSDAIQDVRERAARLWSIARWRMASRVAASPIFCTRGSD